MLVEANLQSKRPYRVLLLMPKHRRRFLQFLKLRGTWKSTDWQNGKISDESQFVLGTDDKRVQVERRPLEQYNSTYVIARHTARTAGKIVRLDYCI